MSDSIFTITVLGTTDLDVKSPMLHVIVRISIVNGITGELLQKSDPERKVISANESSEYIPPVATKGVTIDNLSNLSPYWDEHFTFNEPLTTILSNDVLIFFEILETFIHTDKHGFTPIAWAFLRLRSPEEARNVGRPCQLQLHYYPSQTFDTSIKGNKLPVAGLLLSRRRCNARMTVEVSKAEPSESIEVLGRPLNIFQKETSREPLAKLIERNDADNEEDADKEKVEKLEKKRDKTRTVRPANRNCTVPKFLAAQIPAGERGALAMQFNKNGDILAIAIQELNDYTVQFFSCGTFDKLATIVAHVDLIYEIQFSLNDRLMMTVSADGMAKIWKGYDNYRLKQTLAHPTYVYTGKFHPQDDRLVFTAGMDGIIRMWDRPNQAVLMELKGHETRINSIAFSPDGKQLFSGDAQGVIIAWFTDLEKNGIDDIKRVKIVREGEITKCAITHLEMGKSNFSLMVHTQDSMVRIFETKVMVPSQRYSGILCRRYQMMSTFSPDGQYILGGSEDGCVVLWTVRKAEVVPVKEWMCRFDSPVTAVAWNRVENMVAFSSFGDSQPVLVFSDPDTPVKPELDDLDQF